jgi:ankyrin repeat protein
MKRLHRVRTFALDRKDHIRFNSPGAPKDEVDVDENTAYFIAAQEGFLETVKVLIDAGCDISPAAASGKTAIYAAARGRKLSVLLCIMRGQPARNWKAMLNKYSNNETPIHGAMHGGNAEMVKFLLDAGADGTVNGILESSPLHHAAHYGHKALLSPLLRHAKKPDPRTRVGDTPVHFAARTGKFDFIVQLFQDYSQLGLSIETDAQNKLMKTALTVALDNRFEKGAKFLLERGSISKPDMDGNYPIHQAAWHGFDSIVQLLLDHDGATSKGYAGRTPFFFAAVRGHLKTVKLFAALSDKILNVRDDLEAIPVLAALISDHAEVANYLLDINADC